MYFSRGLNRVQNPYVLKDIYEFYIDEIGTNVLYDIDFGLYTDVVTDYFREVSDNILYKSRTFKMPFGLGYLNIVKIKVGIDKKKMALDWKNSVKYSKQIFHTNDHTDGFKYRFHWSKPNSIVNKYYYKLVMTRGNKRLLAKLIKSGSYDYFENIK